MSSFRQMLTDLTIQAATRIGLRDDVRDSLKMCWAVRSLGGSPTLPAGSVIERYAQQAVPDGWAETLRSAGLTATAESWKREYVDHETIAVYLIRCEGTVVATAGLRSLESQHARCGLLHLVGVRTEHQRKGLGRLVTEAVMRGACAAGLDVVVLATDDHRLPAIKTYLALGFRPCLNSWDRTHHWRWERVARTTDSRFTYCYEATHREAVSLITA